MSDRATIKHDGSETVHGSTLGHLRLRNVETNEIVLLPTPSNDPNDPLNWSKPKKIYCTSVVCIAMFFCNFLAAGPSTSIVQMTVDFFGPPGPSFEGNIAKVAYFFTTTALLQGLGNLIWMPLIVKYGRRPSYLISYTGYTACAIWSGTAKSYSAELASRILLGFFSGSAECIAPLTIVDMWFLHERGLWMAAYNCSLAAGVSGGIILSGLITITYSWRFIYYIAAAFIGAITVLVFFTLPETAYNRSSIDVPTELQAVPGMCYEDIEPRQNSMVKTQAEHIEAIDVEVGVSSPTAARPIPKQHTWTHTLRTFQGTLTEESFWHIFYRPVVLLALPSVLWATLVMAGTIGFLVSISSNFASAFASTYGFDSTKSGLCFISGLIFTFLGLFGGGMTSDFVADSLTKRNGGIREPEMRLPAIMVGLVTMPLGLVLYGVGINNALHWTIPTLGLGFISFSCASATNVSLTYVVDAYRPIAGETIVTQLAFKSCFGFLLSFYTNPWIQEIGYTKAFGSMAGISSAILMLWVPLYIWGKQVRRATMKWDLMTKTIGWNEDREVGE